jgi:hypothetical protein
MFKIVHAHFMALKYNLHEDSYLPKERKIAKNGFAL